MNLENPAISLRALWKISFPMMLTFLSSMIMVFVDRLFLSWYSAEAFTACVQSGTMVWGFVLGLCTLLSMTEVFVAQYNGNRQYEKIGMPIWQMIWVGLFSSLIFFFCGYYVAGWIFPPETRYDAFVYFRYFIYFTPLMGIIHALNGFYVGIQQTKVILWLTIIGNMVNILLDPLFIFGYSRFPSMGAMGAAIATGIGTAVQCFILFGMFLQKKNHEKYRTRSPSFDGKLLLSMIKIGIPPAIFVSIELLGWGLFYMLMAAISPTHIFVTSVCQSILLIFFSFGLGLEKGVIGLAGNIMGARKLEKIPSVIYASMKMTGIFCLLSTLVLIVYPDPIIQFFIADKLHVAENDSLMVLSEVKYLIKMSMIYATFYMIFENIRWIISGILTAAGDTLFLLITGAFSLWIFLLLPSFILSYYPEISVVYSFLIWLIYAMISSAIVFIRYKANAWKKQTVIETQEIEVRESSSTEKIST